MVARHEEDGAERAAQQRKRLLKAGELLGYVASGRSTELELEGLAARASHHAKLDAWSVWTSETATMRLRGGQLRIGGAASASADRRAATTGVFGFATPSG